MSFKRAGNDHCALRLQKKQRVTELLSEDIPANEASKTRHGRFVCLVCLHNPVLDTMAMLTLHRQGKKHLAHMAVKVEQEHSLTELVQKREHEKYLKEASCSTAPCISQQHTIPVISETSDEVEPLLQQTRRVTEGIKKQSMDKMENRKVVNDDCTPKKNQPFFQSRVKISLPDNLELKESSVSQKKCENRDSISNKTGVAKETDDAKLTLVAKTTKMGVTKGSGYEHGKLAKRKELSKEQQRYLELKMSGWILDQSGKWVKDDNVEFDSDEETPPPVY